MPLYVKEFEWSETDSVVTLLIPLKGASKKKVDIFSTNKYIKVCFLIKFFVCVMIYTLFEL